MNLTRQQFDHYVCYLGSEKLYIHRRNIERKQCHSGFPYIKLGIQRCIGVTALVGNMAPVERWLNKL